MQIVEVDQPILTFNVSVDDMNNDWITSIQLVTNVCPYSPATASLPYLESIMWPLNDPEMTYEWLIPRDALD